MAALSFLLTVSACLLLSGVKGKSLLFRISIYLAIISAKICFAQPCRGSMAHDDHTARSYR